MWQVLVDPVQPHLVRRQPRRVFELSRDPGRLDQERWDSPEPFERQKREQHEVFPVGIGRMDGSPGTRRHRSSPSSPRRNARVRRLSRTDCITTPRSIEALVTSVEKAELPVGPTSGRDHALRDGSTGGTSTRRLHRGASVVGAGAALNHGLGQLGVVRSGVGAVVPVHRRQRHCPPHDPLRPLNQAGRRPLYRRWSSPRSIRRRSAHSSRLS